MNDPETFAAFVGIDWAHKKHDICLQPADGGRMEHRVLTHTPEDIDAWARELATRFGHRPIAVCVELTKGPIVSALQKHDFFVLFPVNPSTLARTSHEDYALFASLPGAGDAFAPRLLVALGEDRGRFRTAEELQRYAGIAPVTEQSGDSRWVHWRWSCPTFLRQSFVEWAAQTIPLSYWAEAFYAQQRVRGASRQSALRALAFKWARILFRCWQQRTPYDEAKYLKALHKRRSPLLRTAANSIA